MCPTLRFIGVLESTTKPSRTWEARLCNLRKPWVEEKEKLIDFASGAKWADVEADEITFDRKNIGQLAPDKTTPIMWEQRCGIVKRGHPDTLVLHRLTPKMSKPRAPGPGAIRKVEWEPLAKAWLANKKVILHTDAAKSYTCKVAGVLHDNVRHCKKRVKVAGKWQWKAPTYVRLVTHKLPGTNKKIQCKAGTQVIDRTWRFLKDRISCNQNCRVGTAALRAKLRSAQYEYWMRNTDLWLATGTLPLLEHQIKEVVEQMRRNVAQNAPSVQYSVLPWLPAGRRRYPKKEQFDIVLFADGIYTERGALLLADAVTALLRPKGLLIGALPDLRAGIASFEEDLQMRGMVAAEVTLNKELIDAASRPYDEDLHGLVAGGSAKEYRVMLWRYAQQDIIGPQLSLSHLETLPC
eukprot:s613_g14.t1